MVPELGLYLVHFSGLFCHTPLLVGRACPTTSLCVVCFAHVQHFGCACFNCPDPGDVWRCPQAPQSKCFRSREEVKLTGSILKQNLFHLFFSCFSFISCISLFFYSQRYISTPFTCIDIALL